MKEENKSEEAPVASEETKPAEESTIFDDAEVSENLPAEETPQANSDEEEQDLNITVDSETPKEKLERKGVRKELTAKPKSFDAKVTESPKEGYNYDGIKPVILTIKNHFFTKIKIKDLNGAKIEPKKIEDTGNLYYPGKLGIKFVEDHLVEYLPNFKYFINDKGQINTKAKIWRTGSSCIAKLWQLAVPLMKKPEDEISDPDFYDFLVAKKVEVRTTWGVHKNKVWYRNDIIGFVQ